MIDSGKFNIIGVKVNAIDYGATVQKVVNAAHEKQPLATTALAVHGVMTGALDPVHRRRLNSLDLVVPDGQPVRWALGWLHSQKLHDRVYGPELTLRVCEAAANEDLPIFLFGSTDQTLKLLCENLSQRFPRLQIAGTRASAFRQLEPHERDELAAEIKNSGAAITFVGIGCPRQETWAYEYRELLSMPILAVGAAFSFHAGLLPQAPPKLQKMGLEWVYRFWQEPRRLWKRYLKLNPLYLAMVASQYAGVRRFSDADEGDPPPELRFG